MVSPFLLGTAILQATSPSHISHKCATDALANTQDLQPVNLGVLLQEYENKNHEYEWASILEDAEDSTKPHIVFTYLPLQFGQSLLDQLHHHMAKTTGKPTQQAQNPPFLEHCTNNFLTVETYSTVNCRLNEFIVDSRIAQGNSVSC